MSASIFKALFIFVSLVFHSSIYFSQNTPAAASLEKSIKVEKQLDCQECDDQANKNKEMKSC